MCKLVRDHNLLNEKTVIEINCGHGLFLLIFFLDFIDIPAR